MTRPRTERPPRATTRCRRARTSLGGMLAAALSAVGAAAQPPSTQPVTSPADRTALEGSSSSSYPLGRWNTRLQVLHDDLGTAARSLSGHAYRRDAIALKGTLQPYRVEMSVALSMSTRTASTASRAFQDNAGAPAVVLPRIWVDLPSTTRPRQAPAQSFELQIPYATAFPYPSGGGTLCVDTVVYGNTTSSGINRNFNAYQDAHEQFASGRSLQPGYRYGQGCAPPQGGTAAYASFELRRLSGGMELDISARYGMPTNQNGPGFSALIASLAPQSRPWSVRPSCTLMTSTALVLVLPGANTSQGHWDGVIRGFRMSTGTEFHIQVASGHPVDGVTLSDASHVVAPPIGPQPVTVARVAHGTNRASSTGTVSLVVPVTRFQ